MPLPPASQFCPDNQHPSPFPHGPSPFPPASYPASVGGICSCNLLGWGFNHCNKSRPAPTTNIITNHNPRAQIVAIHGPILLLHVVPRMDCKMLQFLQFCLGSQDTHPPSPMAPALPPNLLSSFSGPYPQVQPIGVGFQSLVLWPSLVCWPSVSHHSPV